MIIWRCLRCDTRLRLRRNWGTKKDLIECKRCEAAYNRSALKDADPVRWEKLRRDKNFTWDENNPRNLRIPGGLGLNPKKEKLKNATSARN